MIELEKTYLAKYIPDLSNCKSKEIIDIYIPKEMPPGIHCPIRIRKNGDRYEFTKKSMISEDTRELKEETIRLTEKEFLALSSLDGKKIHKIRYHYPFNGRLAEIDIFKGALKGLVFVDFEFESKEELEIFEKPEFCLVDIGQEKKKLAGGEICGKSYEEIKHILEQFNYKPIEVKNNG